MSNDLVSADQITKISAIGLTGAGDGASLVPAHLGEVVTFATLMARADCAVPPHLRENPGACLAVCMRAFRLGWDPFALADKTYLTKSRDGTLGKLAYEAQAIMAMINTAPIFAKRPDYEFMGEGPTLQCKVVFYEKDGGTKEYLSPKLAQITPKNSPLWTSDPQQQIAYYSGRAGSRRHYPDIIMGVYTPEEMLQEMDKDEGRVVSFETMEAKAIEVTVVEEKPSPQPVRAAERPSGPAAAASDASPSGQAETAGTLAGGPDTATDSPRPTSTASAQPAETGRDLSASATDAATDSQDQADSSHQAQGDLLADGALEADEDESGFASFAQVVAAARDWPEINLGFRELVKTPAWREAPEDLRNRTRALAFHRLHELNQGGYKFDFLNSAQAYLCYIAWETDPDALRGNRDAMGRTQGFMDLATPDKIRLDKAVADRLDALATGAGETLA